MTNAFATMIIAVLIIAVVFYLLKKYSSKISPKLNSNNISIQGKTSLTPKSHLFIVEVDGEKMLLGVSESNINLVSKLPQEVKQNLQIKATGTNDDLSFKSFLKSTVLKNK